MHYVLIFLLLFAGMTSAFAQGHIDSSDAHPWDAYFHDAFGTDEYDENTLEEQYEYLCMLEVSPLNINEADYEQLSLIPGLTMERISEIIAYRTRYGALRSIEELSMIESIDYDLRVFLSHFLVAKPVSKEPWYSHENLSNLLKNGHGEVLASSSLPLYSREGDLGKYLGDKYKYGVKATMHFADYVKVGFVGAKDGGEPFGCRGNSYGMDYYSFYVAVKDLGRFSNITLGRYRVKYGMGLVQNNNFSFGKQSMMQAMGRSSNIISPHSSRSDANYFQGIAAAFNLGKGFSLSAFTSYRYVDATLNSDGSVATIVTSGYHRTQNEMDKKYNTVEMTSGAHLAFKHEGWHAGATFVNNWLDRDLNPSTTTLYRRYYARGNQLWNASVDYGYTSSRFALSGETAIGKTGGLATLNMLQWKALHDLTLMAVQRYYSYKYNALHANAFSDGGHVQNESGVYLGASWRASRKLTLNAYTDIAYSPWAKYMISQSSYSWDNTMEMILKQGSWTWLSRYRYRLKQRDNEDKKSLIDRHQHRMRISATKTADAFTLRTQFDCSAFSARQENNFGWMLSQSASWKVLKDMEVSGNAAYFHTDNYDTRLYAYEKSLLNTFYIPSFYGEGMRLALFLRSDMLQHFTFIAKIGYTKYFDRSRISSADRMINASHQTDLDLQIRYKF